MGKLSKIGDTLDSFGRNPGESAGSAYRKIIGAASATVLFFAASGAANFALDFFDGGAGQATEGLSLSPVEAVRSGYQLVFTNDQGGFDFPFFDGSTSNSGLTVSADLPEDAIDGGLGNSSGETDLDSVGSDSSEFDILCEGSPITHTVRSGEDAAGIIQSNNEGLTRAEAIEVALGEFTIINTDSVLDPNKIFPGQDISVPTGCSS